MTATGPAVPPFAPGPMSTPDRPVTTSYATKERVWAPPHSAVETTRYATSPTTATGSGTGCVDAEKPGRVKATRCDVPGEVSVASGPTPQPTPSWTSVPVLTGQASW